MAVLALAIPIFAQTDSVAYSPQNRSASFALGVKPFFEMVGLHFISLLDSANITKSSDYVSSSVTAYLNINIQPVYQAGMVGTATYKALELSFKYADDTFLKTSTERQPQGFTVNGLNRVPVPTLSKLFRSMLTYKWVSAYYLNGHYNNGEAYLWKRQTSGIYNFAVVDSFTFTTTFQKIGFAFTIPRSAIQRIGKKYDFGTWLLIFNRTFYYENYHYSMPRIIYVTEKVDTNSDTPRRIIQEIGPIMDTVTTNCFGMDFNMPWSDLDQIPITSRHELFSKYRSGILFGYGRSSTQLLGASSSTKLLSGTLKLIDGDLGYRYKGRRFCLGTAIGGFFNIYGNYPSHPFGPNNVVEYAGGDISWGVRISGTLSVLII